MMTLTRSGRRIKKKTILKDNEENQLLLHQAHVCHPEKFLIRENIRQNHYNYIVECKCMHANVNLIKINI